MITDDMIDAFSRAYSAVWEESAPVGAQGEAVTVERKALRAGLEAALTSPRSQMTLRWALRTAATGGGPCGGCGKALYTHVCLSCSPDAQRPGPGCVNCRHTGMDQTPCLPRGAVAGAAPNTRTN